MKNRSIVTILFALTLVFSGTASAQPSLLGVFNAASWKPAGFPGQGIALGSMFVITGTGMGPDEIVFPGTLPLQTAIAETSVSVTVGGVTKDALMVYSFSKQVAAVLPSSMATGEGTVTVTYNGEASAPFPIVVVSSAFGMFTRNSSGFGPASIQNWYSPTEIRHNSLVDSAIENQYMILWGTGLGPIEGDDSGPPPVGDLPVDVQIFVGGQEVVAQYKGRSSEFPAIDQIQFQVPPGVAGCYVPIVVIVNGVASNFGTMAVNASGGTCTDDVTFQTSDLERTGQGQDTRFGGIAMLGVELTAPGNQESGGIMLGSAKFGSVTAPSMLQSLGPLGLTTNLLPASVGSCVGFSGFGKGIEFDDRVPLAQLDAGDTVQLSAPAPLGTVDLEKDGGAYLIETDAPTVQLVPGLYSFTNGSGTAEVGPLQGAHMMIEDSQFVWTNKDAITSVSRSDDLDITWTGGDDNNEVVLILGHSNRVDLGLIGAFMCMERVSAGHVTIPAWLVSTLPVSSPWNGDGDPTSGVIVGRMSRIDRNRFTAEGLDTGFLFYLLADYRIVPFE